jgi:hypothetical protein
MIEKNIMTLHFGVTYTVIDLGMAHVTLRPSNNTNDITLQLGDIVVFTKNE